MEKLIDSIPPFEQMPQLDKNKEKILSGLCMRFSPIHNMWLVSYGRNKTPTDKFVGTGYSLIEAIDDFKIKLAEFNKTKKQ